MIGKDTRTAAHTMESAFARRHLKERLDKIYDHIHFIPMNHRGIKMLQIMTQEDWKHILKEAMFGYAQQAAFLKDLEHDAHIDEKFYYSHLDGDLCRLIRFRRSLRKYPQYTFVLCCYPSQLNYIREYLGNYFDKDNLEILQCDLDALHTHICEYDETEEPS